MPVLRRPHDYHRDLRARLRAEAPTHTGSGGDQDRYVMMPPPPIDDRPEARYSCWITASSAHHCTGLSDWPALAPPIWSCTVRSTGLYQHRSEEHTSELQSLI